MRGCGGREGGGKGASKISKANLHTEGLRTLTGVVDESPVAGESLCVGRKCGVQAWGLGLLGLVQTRDHGRIHLIQPLLHARHFHTLDMSRVVGWP